MLDELLDVRHDAHLTVLSDPRAKEAVILCLLLALAGAATPLLAHAVGSQCWVFLPAHAPALLAGLLLGPIGGSIVSASTAVADAVWGGRLRGIAFLPIAAELLTYGVVSGALARRARALLSLLGALVGAMVAGRLVYLSIAVVVQGRDVGSVLRALFVIPWPGIAIELAVLPVAAWIVRRRRRRDARAVTLDSC